MAGVEKPVDEKSIVFDYSDNNLNTNLIAKKYHISQHRVSKILRSHNIEVVTSHVVVGQKYGHLTVVKRLDYKICKKTGRKEALRYLCICDCGKQIIRNGSAIRNSKNQSCGCIKLVRSGKNRKDYHGYMGTKLYKCWANMKTRCHNPNVKAYSDYGGRGIKICDEWNDFKVFKNWALQNGYKEGLTIERLDVEKGYTPNNCIWIERNAQNWNRRDTRYISYKGILKSVGEWRTILGVKHYILYNFCKKNNWQLEPFLKEMNIKIPKDFFSHSQEIKDIAPQIIEI